MEFINLVNLTDKINELKVSFHAKKPFKYLVIDNFLDYEVAEFIWEHYPDVSDGVWDNTTYIDQRNKFQKRSFEKGDVFDRFFKELNSPEFLKFLEAITGIKDLIGDENLFGGGLHQSIRGAFLNVHVDYNFHPETKYHRRLNVLLYMNKDWRDEYEGHLELWDLTSGKSERLVKISPIFNRCVIFETNEISFHGHPKPLQTPKGVSRKSIATYYYTEMRPESEIASEHNTIYVNINGFKGQFNRFSSGVKALLERINKK